VYVSFEQIDVGRKYTRLELADIWGYKGFQAISRGIVTPEGQNYIILFLTKEKPAHLTQYRDSFEKGILIMEGDKSHIADKRIIEAEEREEEIHLFYRDIHRSSFTYEGIVFLISYVLNSITPSLFRFVTEKRMKDIQSSIETESITHGVGLDEFFPEPEGRKKIIQSVQYERSQKNRQKALAIHGNKCVVCGFDFDSFYGAELANGYIEVHHTESITEMEGKEIGISESLKPVCSNCHSMVHRMKGIIIPLEDLKIRVENCRKMKEEQ
jgi:5-methylcytosine-specific restriction enzyme A